MRHFIVFDPDQVPHLVQAADIEEWEAVRAEIEAAQPEVEIFEVSPFSPSEIRNFFINSEVKS